MAKNLNVNFTRFLPYYLDYLPSFTFSCISLYFQVTIQSVLNLVPTDDRATCYVLD